MSPDPKTITLAQLPEIIAAHFQHKKEITCYIGSNAATPTASLEAVTAAVKARAPRLPFLKMVHLLLQGPRVIVWQSVDEGRWRPCRSLGGGHGWSGLLVVVVVVVVVLVVVVGGERHL